MRRERSETRVRRSHRENKDRARETKKKRRREEAIREVRRR